MIASNWLGSAAMTVDGPVDLMQWLRFNAELSPLGTFVVAAVAVLAFWQKWNADRKQEWLSRAQWAIDLALESDDRKQATGVQVMEQILATAGNDKDDIDLLRAVIDTQRQRLMDEAVAVRDNGHRRQGRRTPWLGRR